MSTFNLIKFDFVTRLYRTLREFASFFRGSNSPRIAFKFLHNFFFQLSPLLTLGSFGNFFLDFPYLHFYTMLLHSSRFTFTQFGSSMMLGRRWKSLTHVLCTPNRRNSRKIHSAILLNSQFDEFFPSRSQNFIDFLSILAFAHEPEQQRSVCGFKIKRRVAPSCRQADAEL